MKPLTKRPLVAYLRTGDSLGKAEPIPFREAGLRLIERIEGDFTAAVGLPLQLVAEMLRQRGLSCPVDIDQLRPPADPIPTGIAYPSQTTPFTPLLTSRRLKWSSQSFYNAPLFSDVSGR